MKRFLWLLLLVLIWPKVAASQLAGNATIVVFPGTPSGHCNSRQLALIDPNGSLYTCVAAGGTNNGTWQLVAGGGGGGWNPPANTPGNTIFGNNTVGTGSPSFFIPGGDVSFSAGNFSVNSLHFGPTSLALTNTGIATGNCLQVSGSTLIGGACGTGGAGLPGLSSDGTTLTFSGTGGITASQFNSTGTGGFSLTSATAALPALPAAGNNGLVSGPDGWYFSNAGPPQTAWALMGTGGGGGGGVTSFNTRTGAVVPAANDYTVTQVSGAAPIDAPTFTTSAHAPTPAGNSNDTSVATTAWVTALTGASGTVVPIQHSTQAATCRTYDTGIGAAGVTVTGLNILVGDTVVVSITVNNQQTATTAFTSTVTDSGGSTYTQRVARVQPNSPPSYQLISAISTTEPGAAHNATSLTVTTNLGGKSIVCVAAYLGVHALGVVNDNGGTANPSVSVPLTVQANSVMVAGMSNSTVNTASISPGAGALLTQLSTSVVSAATAAMCENITTTGGPIICGVNFSATTFPVAAVALELIPNTTPTGLFPRVVRVVRAPLTPAANVTFCSTTDCPKGLYRISKYIYVSTACPGGTLDLTYSFTDLVGAKTVGLLSPPLDLSTTASSAGGLSSVFESAGTIGQTYTIAQPAACTSGTAVGTIALILERLE